MNHELATMNVHIAAPANMFAVHVLRYSRCVRAATCGAFFNWRTAEANGKNSILWLGTGSRRQADYSSTPVQRIVALCVGAPVIIEWVALVYGEYKLEDAI